MKKLLVLLAVLALVPAAANAATILTTDYLFGTVQPGAPSGDAIELDRLEYLVGWFNLPIDAVQPLPTPDGDVKHVYTLYRPSALTAPLPTPTGTFEKKDGYSLNTYTLTRPYEYLEVKYGQDSAYYYIGGITGDIEFHAPAAFGTTGVGVSHIVLYNPTTTQVPEPATLLLLGVGLAFAGARLRRK